MLKNNKGITMIALAVTIMVLAIIAGITVRTGIEIVKEAKVNDKITILSMIKAKGMGYQEKVDFQAGVDGSKIAEALTNVYETEAGLVSIGSNVTIPELGLEDGTHNYYVPKTALEKMGINKDAGDQDYIISFNDTNLTLEVYLLKPYEGCYSLTQLEGLEIK